MMGHRIALNFEDRVTRRMRSEDYATMQRRSGMADVLAELPEEVITARADPSANRVRLTPPICTMGGDTHFTQFDVLATLGNGRHLMMGDDPRLPKMPAQPRLSLLTPRWRELDSNFWSPSGGQDRARLAGASFAPALRGRQTERRNFLLTEEFPSNSSAGRR
jgi:hypothetical protein